MGIGIVPRVLNGARGNDRGKGIYKLWWSSHQTYIVYGPFSDDRQINFFVISLRPSAQFRHGPITGG